MTDLNSDRYKSKIQIVKHFVYRWDNKITNEYYIGKHSGREDDGYTGSGKLFKIKFIKDTGNWSRTILGYFPCAKTALRGEAKAIAKLYDTDPLCLNLCPGGGDGRYEELLSPKEYKKLLRRKNDEKIALATWIEALIVREYTWFANNLNGDFTLFTTKATTSLIELLNFSKKYKGKYSRALLESCWDVKITNNQVNINQCDDWKEYCMEEQWEEFKLITAALQTMCKEIQEKNNGKNE